MRRLALLLVASLVPACGSSDDSTAAAPATTAASFDGTPRHPVGHTSFVIDDTARGRTLTVHAYYPAAASAKASAEAGVAPWDLTPPGALHDLLATKWPAADATCVRDRAHVAEAAPIADGAPFPVVAFSHCTGCFATSSSAVLEALAAQGFVVLAPDHLGNTLVEAEAGTNAPLETAFLQIRAGDIAKTLDVAIDGPGAPAVIAGKLDAAHVGMLGHSYGALTTGLVAFENPRIKAALAIAAQMEAFGPAKIEGIKMPLGFLVAREDHSINEFGNNQMRDQAARAGTPAWLGEVADAGHWSFSDVPGLVPGFAPGCGSAKRQTSPFDPFTYVPANDGRAEGGYWVSAFFQAFLRGDVKASDALAKARALTTVTLRK